jgi:AhpD family alkylhydroperoxidase
LEPSPEADVYSLTAQDEALIVEEEVQMLKASAKLNRVFESCKEDTLSPKVTELVRLAATLASPDAARSGASALKRATAARVSEAELACAACASACVAGPAAQAVYVKALKMTAKQPFAKVSPDALDKKTTHLVPLAACLASRCACAAGHIVEARRAGATEQELARVGCLAACACGLSAKWSFAEALQCAGSAQQCAC